jgi:hypothetical protein
VPVWVRERQHELFPLGEGLLKPLVEGEVLKSVSRRDPVRDRVDVWTSLNRVYSSSHPGAVQAICRALTENTDVVCAVERDLGRKLAADESAAARAAAERLAAVVARERQEHGL